MRNVKDIDIRFISFKEQAAAIYGIPLFARESGTQRTLAQDRIQEKQHAGLLQFYLAEELFATALASDKEIHSIEIARAGRN